MTLQHSRAAVAAGVMLMAVVMAFGAHADRVNAPPPAAAAQQTSRPGIAVGDIAPRDQMHLVTRPGAYGLSDPPGTDRYAIVGGQLVRIDGASGKILSALRRVERILD
ncbi:MAG: hypothetical protein ACK4YU_02325 [Paracoccus sp. (in: a-proteobacteria)]